MLVTATGGGTAGGIKLKTAGAAADRVTMASDSSMTLTGPSNTVEGVGGALSLLASTGAATVTATTSITLDSSTTTSPITMTGTTGTTLKTNDVALADITM